VAWFRLEGTTRAWDAFAEQAVVDRVARLGGTYYTTGSDQKGPLWLGAYSVVHHLTSARTFWFGIAVGVTVLAALTCAASVAILDRALGHRTATRWLVVAMFAYLVFGSESFTGLLYSRNIVTCLFAVAFAMVLTADAVPPQRRTAVLVGAGIAAGLGVQTMPSSGLVCLVLAVLVWSIPGPAGRRLAPTGIFVASTALSFGSAFVWYAARGALPAFWQDWWTYNKIYSRATGRNPLQQVQHGFVEFTTYYVKHPILAAGVAAAIVHLFVVRRRIRVDRALQVQAAVVCWWVAECVSVAVAQRFYDHYFLLPFTPAAVLTILMLAKGLRSLPRIELIGAGAIVVVTLVSCGAGVRSGIRTLRSFHGFDALASRRVDELPVERQALRAAVAALSGPDDFVFVWSRFPGLYNDIERTAATRFIENRWATGEIYGGSRADENILPGTIDRIMDDLRESSPALVVVPDDDPLPPTGPIADYVAQTFVRAFDGDGYDVYARPDHLAAWLAPRPDGPFPAPGPPPDGSGWSVDGRSIRWANADPGSDAVGDVLTLTGLDACFEVTIATSLAGQQSAPALTFPRSAGDYDGIGLGNAVSGENDVGTTALVLSTPTALGPSAAVRVIVGRDSAAALVDGRLVAVSGRRSTMVALRARADPFTLDIRSYAPRPDLCGPVR